MPSFTSWTEESFNPIGWTDEVWHTGLYHSPSALLYGKYIWTEHHVLTFRNGLFIFSVSHLSVSFSLSPCLCLSLSVSFSVTVSLSHSLSVCLFLSPYLCLSLSLCFCLSLSLSHSLSLSQYNVQAYPTTVIFNGSSVYEYEGRHSADGILEFIQVLNINSNTVVLIPVAALPLLLVRPVTVLESDTCWSNGLTIQTLTLED